MHRPIASLLLAGLATTAALVGSDVAPAEACGAFFAKAAVPVERRPSLAVERVLILHDPEKQVEHFIREVVFRGSEETFGFVVPTPTRPDVFKVKEPMFNRLEESYPFRPPNQGGGDGKGRGAPGATGGAPPPKVVVLDIKKVGSFTAFVLAATDAAALGKWLKDNGLSSTTENDAWLQRYVDRKFYYVAFRYDPSAGKKDDGQPRSETVRITFKTPLAYYPYSEPKHPSQKGGARDVGLWVASPERVIPVALAEEKGRPVWVKPFAEGWTQEGVDVERLQKDLGPEEDKLLGKNPLVVQPFEDQKDSREGFGDVVFIPLKGVPEARRKDAAAMMELLRPAAVAK